MFKSNDFFISRGIRGRKDTLFFLGALHDKILENKEITEEIIGNFLWLRNNYLKNQENKDFFLEGGPHTIEGEEKPLITLYNFVKRVYDVLEQIYKIQIEHHAFNENNYKEIRDEQLYNELEKIKNKGIIEKARGIYGIYVNDQLVYIGETYDSFSSRFLSHRSHVNDKNYKGSCKQLYSYLRECKKNNEKIQLIPLIDISTLKVLNKRHPFTEEEVKCMELALITYLQPKLNISGVNTSYNFL